ncbi:Rv3235 family protein [Kribbella sp. NPDC026611]|uniref:Rv3235 family protein n=1 Tax=Kribbella sp. NPDC026611 TaxID=3154911 RepID=UPI0034014A70
MSQPQNLRADDLQHRTNQTPSTSATPDDLVALVGVATPRLHTGDHTVPATVHHADKLTTDALALRLTAITRLGVTATPTTLSTLAAYTTLQPQSPTPPEATATPAAPADESAEEEAVETPELVVVAGGDDSAAPAVEPELRRLRVVEPGAASGVRVPEVRGWGGRLVLAVSEVLVGDRPVSQLVRFTDEAVFSELNRRVRLLGLNTTAVTRSGKERTVVRSVRVCQPAPNVAEVAAHVRHGGRSRAIALRMEIRRNRWVCTALELG